MDILLCASREAVNEGEIAFADSLCRNMEVFLRFVRNIVRRVFRRIVVLVCIDAED